MSDEATRKAAYRYIADVLDDGPHRDTGNPALNDELDRIRRELAAAGAVPPIEVITPPSLPKVANGAH